MGKRGADATRRIEAYLVESSPRPSAPEGPSASYAEPVRWYLAGPGAWSADRKRAWAYRDPSEALRAIRELRERVMGVEFSLVPAGGANSERPISGAAGISWKERTPQSGEPF